MALHIIVFSNTFFFNFILNLKIILVSTSGVKKWILFLNFCGFQIKQFFFLFYPWKGWNHILVQAYDRISLYNHFPFLFTFHWFFFLARNQVISHRQMGNLIFFFKIDKKKCFFKMLSLKRIVTLSYKLCVSPSIEYMFWIHFSCAEFFCYIL